MGPGIDQAGPLQILRLELFLQRSRHSGEAIWRMCAVAAAMREARPDVGVQALRSSIQWWWQQCPHQKGSGMSLALALADV